MLASIVLEPSLQCISTGPSPSQQPVSSSAGTLQIRQMVKPPTPYPAEACYSEIPEPTAAPGPGPLHQRALHLVCWPTWQQALTPRALRPEALGLSSAHKGVVTSSRPTWAPAPLTSGPKPTPEPCSQRPRIWLHSPGGLHLSQDPAPPTSNREPPYRVQFSSVQFRCSVVSDSL